MRSPKLLEVVGLLTIAVVAVGACSDDEPSPPPVTCAPPPRSDDAIVALAPALGGATFQRPIEIVEGPGKRFYVLEQAGVARVIAREGGAASVAIDLTSRLEGNGEAGLLGIAFDPDFATTGHVYLHFTEKLATPKPGVVFESVVARFQSKDGGATFDPTTEKRILVVEQPYTNHNGGKIAFGPDGFLYIGYGDGGSGDDPQGNGQNKDVLLGKILRIDPRGGDPYAIPPDNPFASGGGKPEIYAYGLRNPWKFSFDRATGDLWLGDVGQNKFEEIDKIVLGGNFGWNVREGFHCRGGGDACPKEGFVDPVVEYGRSEGISITAGYVYRGSKIGSIAGKMIFGDFGSGQIWAVDRDAQGTPARKLLVKTNYRIPTFAQDSDGEIYVADYVSGVVSQLVAADPSPPPEGAGLLSQTGCVDLGDPSRAAPGLVRYSVSSPLWSDGATKDRSLFVPEGAKIGVLPDGDFDLPIGSVAVKTFTVAGKRVETRLLVRYEDGAWVGYSYEWNDEQTDAVLLTTGKTKDVGGGATWTYPSRAECFACHTPVAGISLGLEARQLDHDDGEGNVLDRFAPWLASPVAHGAFPAIAAADAPNATPEARARGYLHANCSFCHREGTGSGAATMDLRSDKPLGETRTCNVAPQAGDVGVAGSVILAPGDPSRSALSIRVRALNDVRMPPLATRVVDEAGAAAIDAWISGLAGCP